MTQKNEIITAWLILSKSHIVSVENMLHQISCNSEDLDPGFCQGRVLTDHSACLVTPQNVLWITQGVGKTSDGSAPVPVLRLVIHPIDLETGLADAGAMLARLICTLPVELVQWDGHTVWLPIDGFREAVAAGQRPHTTRPATGDVPDATRVKSAVGPVVPDRALPGIEDTCDHLSAHLDGIGMSQRRAGGGAAAQTEIHWELPDPDIVYEVPQRLTAWAITLTVSVLALPVGAALIVLTLLKGENIRLAAQTAALTGMFIGLESAGATAQTIELITSIIR